MNRKETKALYFGSRVVLYPGSSSARSGTVIKAMARYCIIQWDDPHTPIVGTVRHDDVKFDNIERYDGRQPIWPVRREG